MVTGVSLTFRPPSEHTIFRITEKPYNRPNVNMFKKNKMTRDVFPFLHKEVCMYLMFIGPCIVVIVEE